MADYNSSFTGAQIDAGITLANSAQQPPAEGPFVNGDKTKLDGIEALADVTDATNVEAAGALMDSEITNLAAVKAFDPTDYATSAQGSLADSAVQPGDLAGVATSGSYTDLSNLPTLGTAAATDSTDYATSAQGALADTAQQPPSEGAFVNGDKTKLDGIEALADVTDATNVEAAGALMDSEVTNLAAVKSFDPTDYATAAQGGLADSAVQPGDLAGVATSGNYTDLSNLPTLGTAAATDSTDYATAAQGALADTAQQPPSEGAFVNGDKTKLDGIEALADITDATNVEAAGALMDSEVTNLAAVKAFDPSDYATAAQGSTADTAIQPGDLGTGVETALGNTANATGGVVTVDGSATLTSKTLTDPAIVGTVLEDVYTISDGAAFEIDPGNGSIQLITLGASRTPKATNFAAGEAVTLMVDDGTAYTLTWTDATFGGSGVVWFTDSGSAPTLNTSGYTSISLWKVGSQVYGARVGDA